MVSYPANNYTFKFNNRNIRTRREICSKLTIKTPVLVPCSSVSIVKFEHVLAAWGVEIGNKNLVSIFLLHIV